MENLKAEDILIALVVFSVCLTVYNAFANARKAHYEEKARREQPTTALQQQIDAHQRMLASDKLRIENLEKRTDDLTKGQKATVKGIQALLEHELHNGNAEQMEQAKSEINDWLCDR